ncbi:MAG: CDP-alcohol phosphatidyltransferase family protein [Candidatus Chromulinivorax sp.]|nr:CDP-alcohol phosphatidyltransferase family protein [Candidatus Chromulinivorax sp.]
MPFVINFSTWLTLSRIFLAPCVMAAIYSKMWLASCLLFIIAGATDFFDGYCARYYHQETEFGRLLDPVADKILIFSTLWALYQVSGQSLLPSWFMYLMVTKDLVLMIGGLFLVVQKKSTVLSPSFLAKFTTALFMLFVVYVILIHYGLMPVDYVSYFIQFFVMSMLLIMFDYSYKFIHYIA